MSMPRNGPTCELATLYLQFLEGQPEKWRIQFAQVTRRRARMVGRLRNKGVITVVDLLYRLPDLSPHLKFFGIESISLLKIRQAIPVLLNLMLDPKSGRGVRVACADALYRLKAGKRVTQIFIKIGKRELASGCPNRHWLEAVILGLGSPEDPAAVELLVNIFTRTDLPG